MTNLAKLFFKEGSPFLPKIEGDQTEDLEYLLIDEGYDPITALTLSTQNVCYASLDFCLNNLEELSATYPINSQNLEVYFQGCLAPTIIISAGIALRTYPVETVLGRLDDNKVRLKGGMFSNDLKRLAPIASEKLSQVNPKFFLQTVSEIFWMCQKDKICKNEYFELGLIASEMAYREFFVRTPIPPYLFAE